MNEAWRGSLKVREITFHWLYPAAQIMFDARTSLVSHGMAKCRLMLGLKQGNDCDEVVLYLTKAVSDIHKCSCI